MERGDEANNSITAQDIHHQQSVSTGNCECCQCAALTCAVVICTLPAMHSMA